MAVSGAIQLSGGATRRHEGDLMSETTPHTWSVEIFIGERDGQTHARARLHTADRTSLEATGTARLNPRDQDVPEIGEELAASRALSALAHLLLDTAASDIEGVTHARAVLAD
jgi:hypothetical protein